MKYESPVLRFSALEITSDLLAASEVVYSPQDPTSVSSLSVGASGLEPGVGYGTTSETPFSW